MTLSDKKKKAVAIAVAYYLEQEAAENHGSIADQTWVTMGKATIMENRARVQRRGRVLPMR